ncbi:MAG: glycosyltransferase [Candidatus Omnitrophota bacterium]
MSDKKLWYLVEDFDPEARYAEGEVLSLTPQASYNLEKHGIRYSILEDFYDEKDLFKDEKIYFREQLSWFKKFDDLFKENITCCRDEGISLATAHYYRLKCLIDSIIIEANMFSRFFGKAEPGKVVYVRKRTSGEESSLYGPFDRQRQIVPLVIERICGREGVSWAVRENGLKEVEPLKTPLSRRRLKDTVKRFHVKSLYYFFKYAKFSKLFSPKKARGMNILSLHAGCISMDRLIRDMICAGGKVFLKTDREIELISGFFHKRVLDLSAPEGRREIPGLRQGCGKVYESFMNSPDLTGWISGKCGFDVSDMFAPYIRDLVENVCREDLADLFVLRDFYDKEKIDFVVARSSSEKESISSLMAAASSGKRVCLQHSCGAFGGERDHISELVLFDHYFAMHDETEEHMKSVRGNDYAGKCRVYQAPYQMETVRERWAEAWRDDKLIMYIPTKLFFGFRSFNGYLYPLTWYFELQKAIVDLFASRKDLRFIFKYAPGQEWSANSILPYIKDKGCKNISIETKTVSECLGEAGRVILDYPSTSFYEAMAAGSSVMSLYQDSLEIRDLPRKLFGRSLQNFRDINDAVQKIEDFLAAPPEEFRRGIGLSAKDAVDVLFEIRKRGKDERKKDQSLRQMCPDRYEAGDLFQ